jgi:trans-2,3-dihydro-3-hydroxyanthranilate isomerase
MARPFHIVDVFAEQPYSGNQLAVVLDADGLSDDAMQQIAAETNYSETTFVSSAQQSDGGFAVRIFTPSHELAFAGHPILGTAWVVRHHVPSAGGATVRLDTGAGPIRVDFEQDLVWFTAPAMSLGAVCRREQMAAALGISPTDIETKGPIQQVSAGTSAVIVPLASLDALHRSQLDLAAFAFLAAEGFPPLIYLFCRETRDPANQLSARFFFESHGVREDPATGNGAAFLGAYLLEHRLFPGDSLALRIEQGYEVRRPSLILLRAQTVERARKISVGGKVIPIVQGELL